MKTFLSILTILFAVPLMSQNTFSYKTANAEVILLAEVNAPRKADNLIGYTPEIAAETAPDNTYPGATNAFLVKKGIGMTYVSHSGSSLAASQILSSESHIAALYGKKRTTRFCQQR